MTLLVYKKLRFAVLVMVVLVSVMESGREMARVLEVLRV
jgi:hypothetical protein